MFNLLLNIARIWDLVQTSKPLAYASELFDISHVQLCCSSRYQISAKVGHMDEPMRDNRSRTYGDTIPSFLDAFSTQFPIFMVSGRLISDRNLSMQNWAFFISSVRMKIGKVNTYGLNAISKVEYSFPDDGSSFRCHAGPSVQSQSTKLGQFSFVSIAHQNDDFQSLHG